MKRKPIFCYFILLALVFLLFLPIPQGSYDDGGTREYMALTYKIVKWNKLMPVSNEHGKTTHIEVYDKISFFGFPNNFKSVDQLWEMECKNR